VNRMAHSFPDLRMRQCDGGQLLALFLGLATSASVGQDAWQYCQAASLFSVAQSIGTLR